MFMHGGIIHLLFNMYALYLFGSILEKVWGSQRFYLLFVHRIWCSILHTGVNWYMVTPVLTLGGQDFFGQIPYNSEIFTR